MPPPMAMATWIVTTFPTPDNDRMERARPSPWRAVNRLTPCALHRPGGSGGWENDTTTTPKVVLQMSVAVRRLAQSVGAARLQRNLGGRFSRNALTASL